MAFSATKCTRGKRPGAGPAWPAWRGASVWPSAGARGMEVRATRGCADWLCIARLIGAAIFAGVAEAKEGDPEPARPARPREHGAPGACSACSAWLSLPAAQCPGACLRATRTGRGGAGRGAHRELVSIAAPCSRQPRPAPRAAPLSRARIHARCAVRVDSNLAGRGGARSIRTADVHPRFGHRLWPGEGSGDL